MVSMPLQLYPAQDLFGYYFFGGWINGGNHRYLVGRYIFKLNWIMLIGAICGGMTSTPGLGAAIEAVGSNEPAAGYVAIYPFALLGMVIFSIILHNLPI
jgi:uncharacterized transporter YbjL